MHSFPLDLTAGDFDAYLPERASSNMYSRPRLEFKQRLLSWARTVVERLEAIDLAMDVHASDEHPSVRNGHRVDCQWVFFWRTQQERIALDALLDRKSGIVGDLHDPSPYYRHAFLALRLDSEKVEVSVQVHPDAWVDYESFRARLNDEQLAQSVVDAIRGLPEPFHFGLSGRDVAPVASVTVEGLRELADRMKQESAALWIGWTVLREVALENVDILDEQLEDALAALGPVYERLAWQRQDDPAKLGETLEAMRLELAQAAARHLEQERQSQAETARARKEQTERSRERTKERIEYDANRSRPTLANLFKQDSSVAPAQLPTRLLDGTPPVPPAAMPHDRSHDRPHDRPDQPDRPDRPHDRPDRPQRNRDSSKKSPQRQEVVSRPRRPPPVTYVPGGSIDKGVQVRVLSGPFAGKVGVIGEVDGRGGARVLLGLLSTRLLVDQLEAVIETKDRPPLQSSHRRNGLLGRSGK